ncbi:MAG: hypothetical protein WD077_06570 [Bacteroidia bacterium]
MKHQRKFYQSIIAVVLLTAALLTIPLIAMQFTNEVNWSFSDFIIAGILLFGTGMSYVLATRNAATIAYRAAFALGIGVTLFLVWANLAVGLIGAGPNPGNLLYIGVVLIAIIGSIISNFRAKGMEHTLYMMTFAIILISVIALVTNMHHYPGSSVNEIIGVNGFFAVLFVISGVAFRFAGDGRGVRSGTE